MAIVTAGLATPAPAGAQDGPARPGDRVTLRIVRDTVVEQELEIAAEGTAFVPLVGDVRLAGIAGNAIQDTLRSRLARFVAPGAVEARLLRRIRVIGDVTKPGVYHVERTYTLRDALALAGGVAESGDARRATLIRGNDTMVRIGDWRIDGPGLQFVESGDQLLVERLPWWRRNATAAVTSAVTLLATIIITLSR